MIYTYLSNLSSYFDNVSLICCEGCVYLFEPKIKTQKLHYKRVTVHFGIGHDSYFNVVQYGISYLVSKVCRSTSLLLHLCFSVKLNDFTNTFVELIALKH